MVMTERYAIVLMENSALIETDTPIEYDGENPNQATEQDYQDALAEMGVDLNG